jgi:hypothetical protein
MSEVTPQSSDAAIGRLNDALLLYASYARSGVDEILAKKGNDLRVQLYRKFSAEKWKGGPGIAEREMRARATQGIGTRISRWVRNNPGDPPISLHRLQGTPAVAPAPAGLNRQQALVWREVQARQAGIGILAVSWLLRRWRHNNGGKRLVANKTDHSVMGKVVTNESREFGTLAQVEQRPGMLRLTGFTPGMDEVAERYGIVSDAVDAVTDDMMPYIERKMAAAAQTLFPATL